MRKIIIATILLAIIVLASIFFPSLRTEKPVDEKAVKTQEKVKVSIEMFPVDSGKTEPEPGTYYLDKNSDFQITATPSSQSEFYYWQIGREVIEGSTLKLKAEKEMEIRAVFLPLDVKREREYIKEIYNIT